MVGHEGSSAGSYFADPTSPIPSHCTVIILFKSVPVHQLSWLALRVNLLLSIQLLPYSRKPAKWLKFYTHHFLKLKPKVMIFALDLRQRTDMTFPRADRDLTEIWYKTTYRYDISKSRQRFDRFDIWQLTTMTFPRAEIWQRFYIKQLTDMTVPRSDRDLI